MKAEQTDKDSAPPTIMWIISELKENPHNKIRKRKKNISFSIKEKQTRHYNPPTIDLKKHKTQKMLEKNLVLHNFGRKCN